MQAEAINKQWTEDEHAAKSHGDGLNYMVPHTPKYANTKKMKFTANFYRTRYQQVAPTETEKPSKAANSQEPSDRQTRPICRDFPIGGGNKKAEPQIENYKPTFAAVVKGAANVRGNDKTTKPDVATAKVDIADSKKCQLLVPKKVKSTHGSNEAGDGCVASNMGLGRRIIAMVRKKFSCKNYPPGDPSVKCVPRQHPSIVANPQEKSSGEQTIAETSHPFGHQNVAAENASKSAPSPLKCPKCRCELPAAVSIHSSSKQTTTAPAVMAPTKQPAPVAMAPSKQTVSAAMARAKQTAPAPVTPSKQAAPAAMAPSKQTAPAAMARARQTAPVQTVMESTKQVAPKGKQTAPMTPTKPTKSTSGKQRGGRARRNFNKSTYFVPDKKAAPKWSVCKFTPPDAFARLDNKQLQYPLKKPTGERYLRAPRIRLNLPVAAERRRHCATRYADVNHLFQHSDRCHSRYRLASATTDSEQPAPAECVRCEKKRKRPEKPKGGKKTLQAGVVTPSKMTVAEACTDTAVGVWKQRRRPTVVRKALNRWENEFKSRNEHPAMKFFHTYHWAVRMVFVFLDLREGRLATRTTTLVCNEA